MFKIGHESIDFQWPTCSSFSYSFNNQDFDTQPISVGENKKYSSLVWQLGDKWLGTEILPTLAKRKLPISNMDFLAKRKKYNREFI